MLDYDSFMLKYYQAELPEGLILIIHYRIIFLAACLFRPPLLGFFAED